MLVFLLTKAKALLSYVSYSLVLFLTNAREWHASCWAGGGCKVKGEDLTSSYAVSVVKWAVLLPRGQRHGPAICVQLVRHSTTYTFEQTHPSLCRNSWRQVGAHSGPSLTTGTHHYQSYRGKPTLKRGRTYFLPPREHQLLRQSGREMSRSGARDASLHTFWSDSPKI